MNMRRPGFLSIFVGLFLVAWTQSGRASRAAAGQAGSSAALEQTKRFKPAAGVDELIRVDVVVTDTGGKPVTNLDANDFTLMDGGQPSAISTFREVHSPRSTGLSEVIILLDSMYLSSRELTQAESQLQGFLRQNDGQLKQPVSIFLLTSGGLWMNPLLQRSRDGNRLASALDHKGDFRSLWSEQTTSFGNLAERSRLPVRAVASIAADARRQAGRKLLIVVGSETKPGVARYFTVGEDPRLVYDQSVWLSTVLREARLPIYSLAVGDPASSSLAAPDTLVKAAVPAPVDEAAASRVPKEASSSLELPSIARQSGGRVCRKALDIKGLIEQSIEEAGSFYSVTFAPAPVEHTDEYRDLKVLVRSPGLKAATNAGYYDEPFYRDLPNASVRRIDLAELDRLLSTASRLSDGDLARELSELALTERLSSARLASWQAKLRGAKGRQALAILADSSAFLSPPVGELPNAPPPDQAAQQKMLQLAIAYLRRTIPRLPNFMAQRSLAHYEETRAIYAHAGDSGSGYKPFHKVEDSKDTVLYRQGVEVVEAEGGKRKKESSEGEFVTKGTFGPILGTVVDAIAAGNELQWSRWEKGAAGNQAVFRYSIPEGKSRYQVASCCLPDGNGDLRFQKLIGFHGEINLDPESGAILRLSLQADLQPQMPLVRSDIVVEYGPVQIGGNTYNCPLRSISVSRERTVRTLYAWNESFRTYGPFASMMNEVSFGGYHLFHAESRLVVAPSPIAEPDKSPR